MDNDTFMGNVQSWRCGQVSSVYVFRTDGQIGEQTCRSLVFERGFSNFVRGYNKTGGVNSGRGVLGPTGGFCLWASVGKATKLGETTPSMAWALWVCGHTQS